jgi:hypothetical protein
MIQSKIADSFALSNSGGGVSELPGFVECKTKLRLTQLLFDAAE